jgi:hypothetical protein
VARSPRLAPHGASNSPSARTAFPAPPAKAETRAGIAEQSHRRWRKLLAYFLAPFWITGRPRRRRWRRAPQICNDGFS